MNESRMSIAEIKEAITRVGEQLTPKRKAFADNYIANGGNGTEAYAEAFGAKKSSAGVGSSKLLRRDDVSSYIKLCSMFTTDELLDYMTVTKTRVLDEESKLAFIDIRKMFDESGEILPPNKWPEEIARAAAGIDIDQRWDAINDRWSYKYKVRLNDKGRALQRLEAILGMNKNPDMNDSEKELMKSFLQSIDGDTRGKLPSELDD